MNCEQCKKFTVITKFRKCNRCDIIHCGCHRYLCNSIHYKHICNEQPKVAKCFVCNTPICKRCCWICSYCKRIGCSYDDPEHLKCIDYCDNCGYVCVQCSITFRCECCGDTMCTKCNITDLRYTECAKCKSL